MAKSSNNDLLTIGEMFKTVAGEFKIMRKVGRGATGEVYQAQSRDGKRTVAIKMMLPSNLPSAVKEFINEGLTLQKMRSAEKKQEDPFFTTPDFFGAEGKSAPPYIVEEFMTGKPFPELVSGDAYISEEEVVSIGAQLFRTLHLLAASPDLKKSYIDLKFENLWWDREKKVLKITDWGTLEDTNPASQARDNLRAALYIYRLATGRTITESRGIVNQAMDKYPEWEKLSWGLQEILRRLLHPTPSVRVGDDLLPLGSAEEIAEKFKSLEQFWETHPDELIEHARQFVDAAQKAGSEDEIQDQTRYYRFARTALEIAAQRGIANREQERLLAIVKPESDYFKRAYGLYDGTSYAPARKLFRLGAELLSSSKLRRWAWLAHAGELARGYRKSKEKELAERAVELMEDEQYVEAGKLLDSALVRLQLEALKALRLECEVLDLLQQAVSWEKESKYEEAERAYRTADDIWAGIDGHEEWKDKVGDLQKQVDIVHIRGVKQGKVRELIQDAETAKELKTIRDKFREALFEDPGNPDAYARIAEMAGERFDTGLLEDAALILWVGGTAPATPPDAVDWRCPDEIRQALEYSRDSNLDALSRAALYAGAIRNDPAALPFKLTVALLDKHFDPAISAFDLNRAGVIADLMKPLNPLRAQEMKEQVQQREKENRKMNIDETNRLIVEASRRIFPDEPAALQGISITEALERLQNRLRGAEEALEFLDQASRLVGSEDEALKSRIVSLIQHGKALKDQFIQEQIEQSEQKRESILTLRENLLSALERLDHFEQASSMLSKATPPVELNENALTFEAELLIEVNELLDRLGQLDPNDGLLKHQTEIKNQIAGLGDHAMFAVAEDTRQAMRAAAMDALLKQAQVNYDRGKVVEAAETLRKIETLDAQAGLQELFRLLKVKVTALLGIKYWEKENEEKLAEGKFDAGLLGRIARHFSAEIEPQFRKNVVSIQYLQTARKNLREELVKIQPVESPTQFTDTLQNLAWVDNLYRLSLAWQKNKRIDPKKQNREFSNFTRGITQAYRKWRYENFTRKIVQACKSKTGNLNKRIDALLDSLPVALDPEAHPLGLSREHIQQEISRMSQPKWLKWTMKLAVPTLLLIALTTGGIIGWPLVKGWLPSPVPSEAATASATPTELPTNTPEPTTTPLLISPTVSPTQTTSLLLVFEFCAKQGVNIRSGPGSAFDFIVGLKQGECLRFDGSIKVGNELWLHIAPGQVVDDKHVGGYWVIASSLQPKDYTSDLLEITVTPTP